MNNMALERAQKWFSELNIRTEVAPTFLKVNRSDMLIIDSTQLPEVYAQGTQICFGLHPLLLGRQRR